MKIAAIVPAYNEESSVGAVVSDLNKMAASHNLHLDVIVVNDCSTDRTSEIVSELDCIPLDLPVNLGIGGAVQTGFRYAFENKYDFAVQVDGDGQHPADAIPLLLKKALDESADVIIGSRFLEKDGFQSSSLRRFGIAYFTWLNSMLVGTVVHDSTSGFRMVSRKVMECISDYYPDEYPEPEAIIIFSMNNFKITEVPVIMRERQGGVSSIGAVASVYYMIKVTLAVIFTFWRMRLQKNKSPFVHS